MIFLQIVFALLLVAIGNLDISQKKSGELLLLFIYINQVLLMTEEAFKFFILLIMQLFILEDYGVFGLAGE